MKKINKIAITAISLVTLGTTFTNTINIVKADDISDTKAAITTKQTEAEKVMADIKAAQDAVMKINNDVSNKLVEISTAKTNISKAQDKIASLDGDITKAKSEIKSRKDVLKEQVIALQEKAGDSVSGNVYLDFIVNSENLGDLFSRAMTLGKINNANKTALDAVKDAEDKLSDLKQEQVDKKAELVATKDKLEKDYTQLSTLKTNAETKQTALEKELADHKDEIASLQTTLAAQQKTASDAAAALAQQQAAAAAAASASVSSSTISSSSSADLSGLTSSAVASGGVISIASQYLGVPYVWGGSTPSGFDCSGLTSYVFNLAGKSIPRTSQEQSTVGTYVSTSDLQAGDLVFWGGVGSAHHVGIYIGGGQYIHAPQPGENVKIGSVAWYTPDFGRRI